MRWQRSRWVRGAGARTSARAFGQRRGDMQRQACGTALVCGQNAVRVHQVRDLCTRERSSRRLSDGQQHHLVDGRPVGCLTAAFGPNRHRDAVKVSLPPSGCRLGNGCACVACESTDLRRDSHSHGHALEPGAHAHGRHHDVQNRSVEGVLVANDHLRQRAISIEDEEQAGRHCVQRADGLHSRHHALLCVEGPLYG